MLFIYLLFGALVLLSYSSPTDRLTGETPATGGDILIAIIAWFVVLPIWPLAAGWRACTTVRDWYTVAKRPEANAARGGGHRRQVIV
ncbi:hypothetical protein [Streptomyces sp. NPDC053560]|uniref:hypothetical protein n=1 Tax=Streptomyces sp. NPDC053560 TaxID=3365711 RepID=UPI0037D837B5